MRVPARCVLAGVAFVSALLGVVGAARAERVIALLEIEGARDEDMRKAIGKLITDEVRIISVKTYERAAKRLHAEKLNTGDVRKVCDYLETDGVIDGTLVAEDDGYKLVLRLREGASGRIAWRQRITLKTPALGAKLKPELKRRLMREIEELEGIDASRTATAGSVDEDAEETDDEEAPRKKTKAELRAERREAKKAERERKREEAIEARERKREEAAEAKERKRQAAAEAAAAAAAEREEERATEEERRARKKRRASREDEDEDEPRAVDVEDDGEKRAKGGDEEDFGDEEDEDADDKKKVAAADDDDEEEDDKTDDEDPLLTKGFEDGRGGADPRERAVILNLGASVIARRLKFKYDPEGLAENQEPLPYKGSPVPGIYLAGEVYPAAFGGGPSSIVKNIGIGFVFDRVFKLNSRIETGDGTELATVSTTQQRFGASLRYRHNFGTGNAAPTLYGFVGYNRSQFELAKDEVEEMIAIPNTTYSYLDPGLGGRLGIGDAIGVLAEARVLAVLDAGEIQEPDQYGAATITGFDADLMAEYWITPNILARIGGHLMYLGYDFEEGTGTLQDPDSDMEPDVGGARDVWFGGFLTVGYAY